ncbi:MAG: class I adenylate-forming enzyme family protein [Acidimicrobiia bacterium]
MDDVLDRYGVAAHARLRPDKVALICGDRRMTYREIDAAATGMAHVLRARGVGPDARLGIALHNRPEWMVAALGAARLGAQVVPIPHGATPEERAYFCDDGEVAFLLDEDGLEPFLAEAAAAPTAPIRDASPDYVVLRPYTSGTTGQPKAVLRAVGSAEAAILGMVRYYESYGIADPDEVNLTGSPLHHLAGFSGPHSALIVGHTSVLLDHFDAAEAVRVIEAERVTYWICAPVHLYRLTRLPQSVRDRADLSSLRRVMHGSAPCAPSLKREVMELFPPGAVWETYGGTETMGTVITPEEWLERPGSVGRPALGSTIKILDDHGAELPAGETGLIYIGSDWGRGFRYAGPDELTESIYRGDLATLGDVGYVDEDGYLFVVDRRKDLVITGGANVYPAEVETVLVRHPNVGEVAVIGVPDDEYGEIVTAIVVADGPLTAEDVISFAKEHLVAYKCPRRVELVAELPRDPMGKIRKRALRATFS